MQIIPVIDLKNGIVVHARHGDRDNYNALVSDICPTSNTFDLIQLFKQDFNFGTTYIADLNALMHNRNNSNFIVELLETFPDMEFWVDCGFPLPDFGTFPNNNYVPVIGSESLTVANYPELLVLNRKFVLSLDFSYEGLIGPQALFTDNTYWPSHIILMTLAKVGSNQGPDVELLRRYVNAYPESNFIAAGGIRNYQDLMMLEKLGIGCCLVASALHNGNLGKNEIAQLQTKKYPDARGIF